MSASGTRTITAQERWEGFLYSFVETGWFDHEDRPKTMTAMREVFEKIPSEIWDEMPNLLLFAPAPGIRGQVYPQLNGDGIPTALVYLSPELESEDSEQAEVNFTVAHELAHVFLGHYQMQHEDLIETAEEAKTTTYLTQLLLCRFRLLPISAAGGA